MQNSRSERARSQSTAVPTSRNSYHRFCEPSNGKSPAEVGFLLILFAGIWLIAAQIPAFKMSTVRTIVAGAALALAGLLLIIATQWGHFG